MLWFLLAVLGAFLNATYHALIKKSLGSMNQYTLSAGVFTATAFILLVSSWLRGFPEILPGFYTAVGATGVINIVAIVLLFKALKATDLSLALPLMSFTPVFLVISSFLMLGEVPTALGGVGIVLVGLGSYVAHTTVKQPNLLAPLKAIWHDRGALYVLIVAFLYSISANYDKLAVQTSDELFSSGAIFLLVGLAFLLPHLAMPKQLPALVSLRNLGVFLGVGLIVALVSLTINAALIMQIVPYVNAVKRAGVLFGVFYGFLLFKEKNSARRMIGSAIMVAGVALIVVL